MLPRTAPDFWAFRHRAVEFVEAPKPKQIAPVAQVLAWTDWSSRTLEQDTDAKIALREGLLQDLPESDETLAARADLLYTLGTLYDAKQEYDRALKHHKQALSIFKRLGDTKRQSWTRNSLGNIYHNLGRYEEAEAAYRKAIDLDPENAYPWNGLGTVYADLGRHADAEAAYRQAIDLDPDYAAPWNNLGSFYGQQGRYEEAEAAFRKAIDLDPENAYPWNNLGTVYHNLGRYEEAEAAYRQAIDLDPDDADYHNNLGNVYRALGRYEEAEAAFRKVIELDQSDAFSHTMLGTVLQLQGQLEKALAEHQEAVKLEPQNGTSRASLVSILRKVGKREEANEHLALARELMANESEYNKACIEAIVGNVDAALAHLERALAQVPGDRGWAARDPDLEALHGDPRFEALVGGET
jgi:tetratricopeptide (TPR) repeat protein